MAWQLQIHTIDVGQGDSSLIIAYDDANPALHKTLLIDGGEADKVQVVHDYVCDKLAALGLNLDYILITHYDTDHWGGIERLLTALSLARSCRTLTTAVLAAVAAAQARGCDQKHQVASAAAALYLSLSGAYDNGTTDCSSVAVTAATTTDQLPMADLNAAITAGLETGMSTRSITPLNALHDYPFLVPLSIRNDKALIRNLCAEVSEKAAETGTAAQRQKNVFAALFDKFRGRSNVTLATDRVYNHLSLFDAVRVYDNGAIATAPTNYSNALAGLISAPAYTLTGQSNAPCQHEVPALGAEILWGTNGGNPVPAQAPKIFVGARGQVVYRNATAIGGGTNGESIALVLRFNNFYFYTGGDLPTNGENLIAAALAGTSWPATIGRNVRCIAAFKCGHHGSIHSTDDTGFLDVLKPVSAFISCGKNTFGDNSDPHPMQLLVNRLVASPTLNKFYLTNCNYRRDGIPASEPPSDDDATLNSQRSVPNNKSRVAGDNKQDNKLLGRHRGDIVLRVTEAASLLAANEAARTYTVEYYDDDTVGGYVATNESDTITF